MEIDNNAGTLKASINAIGDLITFEDYDAETAPSFLRTNWTLTAGWDATNVSDTALDKSSAGTTTATATGGTAPIVGTQYELTFTVANSVGAGSFTGNVTPSIGSRGFPAITAIGTYTYYFTATSTNRIVFTPSTTGARFSINALSIKPVTAGTGDIKAGGDLIGKSRLRNNSNQTMMFWDPDLRVSFPNTVTISGTTTASTVTASGPVTGRQLITTVQTTATTTGAVTHTLTSGGLMSYTSALTGGITHTLV